MVGCVQIVPSSNVTSPNFNGPWRPRRFASTVAENIRLAKRMEPVRRSLPSTRFGQRHLESNHADPAKYRPYPDHPYRQPAAAAPLLDVMKAKYAGQPYDEKAFKTRCWRRPPRCRPQAGRLRHRHRHRRRILQAGLLHLCPGAARRFRIAPGHKNETIPAGGRGVSRILRRVFQAGDDGRRDRQLAPVVCVGPGQVSRRETRAERHRQREGRGGSGRCRQRAGIPAGDRAVGRRHRTSITGRTKSISTRSPPKWRRNTGRSSMPAFSCRSTIRSCRISSYEPGLDEAQKKRRARNLCRGDQYRPERHSGRSGCGSIPATASTKARAFTKRRSSTSSITCCRSMPAHTVSRLRIPATSTNIICSKGQGARGQGAGSRRGDARQQHRRASRTHRRAYPPLRPAGRARKCHRRRRLRILLAGSLQHRGAPHRGVGEVQGHASGCRYRFPAALGLAHDPEKWWPVFREDHAPLKSIRARNTPPRTRSGAEFACASRRY